ncbi:helix-turn-helix domain-containing protein [Plantactinospora sp. B5E13]|uniref:AraC family transcriptional regulator n=1 Tax=unclassified Plantactinospora TaxID=2631981 RepID=UPI00325D4F05
MVPEPRSELVQRLPAPPLRPFLAPYVGYRDRGVPPGRHRGLPSPHLTLIITLDDPLVVTAHPDPRTPPGRYDTLVGGLHTAPALIEHDGRQSGVQLSLSPLGARALLGLPAGELAAADLSADLVLGPFAGELRERLLGAASWSERFDVLDRLLVRRLDAGAGPPAELVRAWHRLLASGGTVPVGELARQTGWSGRYLSRRFGVEVGLSPKRAARVVRFDRARRLLQRQAGRLPQSRIGGPAQRDQTRRLPQPGARPGGPAAGLAEVAAVAGYYDQAHLDRDFREFAGCPPSRWLAEEFRNVQAGRVDPPTESSA